MKICAFSDTHGEHHKIAISSDEKIDLMIFAGDFACTQDELELIEFLDWFSNFPSKHKIFVAGNHDLQFEDNFEYSKEMCQQRDIIYLQDEAVNIEGLKVYGSPWTPIFRDTKSFKKEAFGQELNKIWDKIPHDLDILITHGAPYEILDLLPAENNASVNAGDKLLLDKIKKVKPKIHVFGHCHLSGGDERNSQLTRFFNVSGIPCYFPA